MQAPGGAEVFPPGVLFFPLKKSIMEVDFFPGRVTPSPIDFKVQMGTSAFPCLKCALFCLGTSVFITRSLMWLVFPFSSQTSCPKSSPIS